MDENVQVNINQLRTEQHSRNARLK